MDKNIQKYLALIKTVEYGSFTKAAEALNYSQSGISRMINDLEAEWKISLLERGRSGVRLTSEGLKVLPYAKSVCNEYQNLQTQIDELHGLQSGLIRIGTFSSVATHWLPNIIKAFQKTYPNIDYELLLGDYTEIESWILEGRVDCGFLRLPTQTKLDTIFLEQDKLLVILPENHSLADCDRFPVKALGEEPFMLLEKGAKAEISEILGISILPELILKRIPYRIVLRELEIPAYRKIGLAMKDKESASLAVKRFLDYLQYRSIPEKTLL
ncbi:LysR family transcriptional regulator [Paenibacillus peoriae]|uniref:LysR family transcriptional regulator n=1 Tax=Paenibacillus peoriae TaxID=59893 RepID=UPI00026C601F|nr:LysR family transcriptional regulator [Paenibacillus peoriae]MEC0184793.1 LysR family transcriptional regulator [Paenibacillus peoriae]